MCSPYQVAPVSHNIMLKLGGSVMTHRLPEQMFCRNWKQCWKWGWWSHSVCYNLYPTIHVIKNVKRVKCHCFMLIPCPWSKSSWKLTKGSWKSSFSSESREVGITHSIQYTNLIHLLSVSLFFLGTSWTGCSVLCCYLDNVIIYCSPGMCSRWPWYWSLGLSLTWRSMRIDGERYSIWGTTWAVNRWSLRRMKLTLLSSKFVPEARAMPGGIWEWNNLHSALLASLLFVSQIHASNTGLRAILFQHGYQPETVRVWNQATVLLRKSVLGYCTLLLPGTLTGGCRRRHGAEWFRNSARWGDWDTCCPCASYPLPFLWIRYRPLQRHTHANLGRQPMGCGMEDSSSPLKSALHLTRCSQEFFLDLL